MSETTYLASAIQFEPVLFDKPGNITRLAELVTQAAAGGAKLITTPEMAISGYCFFGPAEAETMAEPVPGPATDVFAELAAIHDCHIVIGMPERDPDTGLLYNSAVLIGPGGSSAPTERRTATSPNRNGPHRETGGIRSSTPPWAGSRC
nr:nitrilase-related carbon-nitrogen hydrolase [Mycolicibacterium mengxianglii]